MRTRWAPALAVVIAIGGCNSRSTSAPVVVAGGDVQRGKSVIASYGCGSCHTIRGISGAWGLVGPPLTGIGARQLIAGVLPNTPENMIQWIRDPHAVDEKTAMPVLGVNPQEAADIASYLYSIR